jgi:hypothetical protein
MAPFAARRLSRSPYSRLGEIKPLSVAAVCRGRVLMIAGTHAAGSRDHLTREASLEIVEAIRSEGPAL